MANFEKRINPLLRRGNRSTMPVSGSAGEPRFTLDTKEYFIHDGERNILVGSPSSLKFKYSYNENTTYDKFDLVEHNSNIYISLKENNEGNINNVEYGKIFITRSTKYIYDNNTFERINPVSMSQKDINKAMDNEFYRMYNDLLDVFNKKNLFLGSFVSIESLEENIPEAKAGQYAYVDVIDEDAIKYLGDDTDNKWIESGGAGRDTPQMIKEKYESNPDTNPFTDVEKENLSKLFLNSREIETLESGDLNDIDLGKIYIYDGSNELIINSPNEEIGHVLSYDNFMMSYTESGNSFVRSRILTEYDEEFVDPDTGETETMHHEEGIGGEGVSKFDEISLMIEDYSSGKYLSLEGGEMTGPISGGHDSNDNKSEMFGRQRGDGVDIVFKTGEEEKLIIPHDDLPKVDNSRVANEEFVDYKVGMFSDLLDGGDEGEEGDYEGDLGKYEMGPYRSFERIIRDYVETKLGFIQGSLKWKNGEGNDDGIGDYVSGNYESFETEIRNYVDEQLGFLKLSVLGSTFLDDQVDDDDDDNNEEPGSGNENNNDDPYYIYAKNLYTEGGFEEVFEDAGNSSLSANIEEIEYGDPGLMFNRPSGYENSSTEGIIIPIGTTQIGVYAFAVGGSINTPLIIPNTVERIEDHAFVEGHSYNHPLIIPESVTYIGSSAFSYGGPVPYIIMKPETPPTLNNIYVFGDQNDAPIYVPDESVEAYKTETNGTVYVDRIKPISELEV